MPSEILAHSELGSEVEKLDRVALQILLEEIDRQLAVHQNALLFTLSNWFLSVSIFRKFEERELIGSDSSPGSRQHHRAYLTRLLAQGERLSLELEKHSEIEPKHIGIELGELQAVIEELRLKYAEWFQEITDERRTQILREAFAVEASAA